MEKPLDHDAKECLRCCVELTESEIKTAAEDELQYCVLCREAVARLRLAVRKAHGGLFKTGL